MQEESEAALTKQYEDGTTRLSEHTKSLTPLVVGMAVMLQNQVGPPGLARNGTGVVSSWRPCDMTDTISRWQGDNQQ